MEKEEVARRGHELYQTRLRSLVEREVRCTPSLRHTCFSGRVSVELLEFVRGTVTER